MKKRTILLIYPKFQLPLIFWNILIFLGVTTVQLFVSHKAFTNFKELGETAGFDGNHPYFAFIERYEAEFMQYALIGAGVGFICFITANLILSHKISGPICRLKSYFSGLEKNKKPSLAFRKNDFFSELPEVINSALERVSK
jgi:hypothetical protein